VSFLIQVSYLLALDLFLGFWALDKVDLQQSFTEAIFVHGNGVYFNNMFGVTTALVWCIEFHRNTTHDPVVMVWSGMLYLQEYLTRWYGMEYSIACLITSGIVRVVTDRQWYFNQLVACIGGLVVVVPADDDD
jgi:CRISPR/Cas system endoribonuclease Cas6 (RAMP superfamily)